MENFILTTNNATGAFNNDWVNIPDRTASPPGMAYLPYLGHLDIVVRASHNSLLGDVILTIERSAFSSRENTSLL